jgi:hypothetical protein
MNREYYEKRLLIEKVFFDTEIESLKIAISHYVKLYDFEINDKKTKIYLKALIESSFDRHKIERDVSFFETNDNIMEQKINIEFENIIKNKKKGLKVLIS